MSNLKTPDSAAKHSAMYKLGSPSPLWRETYKKRCTERLKSSRLKLMNRFRRMELETQDDTDVQEVMQQEWVQIETSKEVSFDEVLSTMEEIKAELLQWERETLLEYEQATFNNSITQLEQVSDETAVVCPLCNSNYISIYLGCLRCVCGLMVNTEQDCIDLSYVKKCLEEGVSSHSSNCIARPVFNVVKQFGTTNLLLTCNTCDYMFIVV